MTSIASAPIDFRQVRPLKGTKHGGFEELCVSLFREEMGNPPDLLRIDGAGGDGGVEAYVQTGPQRAVGLQAKYFEQLRDRQWRQISESIRQARKNHPTLKVYYVAVPLDLNPHAVKKWKVLQAAARRMSPSLQLIWWGSSELTGRLTTVQHAGRAAYWFGTPQFNSDWLAERNREARSALDTRYTPKHHVRVRVQDVLSAFAREPRHLERYYEQARTVWKAMRGATGYPPPKEVSNILGAPFAALVSCTKKELPRLGDGLSLPPSESVNDAAKKMLNAIGAFSEAVQQAKEEAKKIPSPPPSPTGSYQANVRERLGFRDHELRKAMDALYEFAHFLAEHIAADRRRLLVSGDAGSGKSHLLARVVEECQARGQPVLFVLGEFFTTSADPWSQLTARLGWNATADDLLAALNHAGELKGLPSLIVIDAINETPDRAVWLNHLTAFSNRIERWPWVRLVVSCRTDFIPICLPAEIARQENPAWAFTRHHGFGDTTFEATARYFAAYGVRARDLPPLLPEFQNPLFLKTFCEAFENSPVPSGSISLDLVMNKRIARSATLLEQSIDCPADVTQTAVKTLATLIAAANGQAVPIAEARAQIDALFPGRPRSRSLFHHLCSSGLVTEVGHYDYRTQIADVRVRFAYERFSDYFIAQRLLAGVTKAAQLRERWKKQALLAGWRTYEGYFAHRGLLSALAILLPEKFKVELAGLVDGKDIRKAVLEDFLAGLPWRSAASITPKSHALLQQARKELPADHVLAVMIRMAAVVGHPFNAHYIDRWLRMIPLWRREQAWTIPISQQLAEHGETSMPTTFVRWLFKLEMGRLPDEQARLVAILLCWFFSTNDRGFRRRATLAAIRVVSGRCQVAAELIEHFHTVDDLYVVERVFAAAAGAAVREKDAKKLGPLAEVVWRRMFALKRVPPHVLLRDFAFTVMECARNLGCLPKGVAPEDYRPPYRSRWPKIWTERKARAFGKPKGWHTIVYSIEPEYGNRMGGYGDFGRYVMEAHMHAWLNARRSQPYPAKGKRKAFKGLIARAWTLQRVAQLGWTPERFAEYEKNLPDRGRSADEDTKQERISKKYQWIALHELEGYASDHFHFGRWYEDGPTEFQGAWQLFSRNFDPAQPLRDPLAPEAEGADDDKLWWKGGADPFADPTLIKNPSAWVATLPESPAQLLLLSSVRGLTGPALLLNAWFSWDEPEPFPPRTGDAGKYYQFIHVRSWLVPRTELAERLRFLRKMHFWGDGVQLPQFGSEGLGEYPWSSRFDRLREACADNGDFGGKFPPGFLHTVAEYSESDASASVPSPQLAKLLGVTWTGSDFNFADARGVLVAFTPRRPPKAGSTPCLVDYSRMLEMLKKNGLALIWGVVGERNCFGDMATGSVADKLMSFSGVYVLEPDGKVTGGLTMRDITLLEKQHSGLYSGATEAARESLPDGKIVAIYGDKVRKPRPRTPARKVWLSSRIVKTQRS
jgi:hypothetical protein